MSRALIILNTDDDRKRASSWVEKAPAGTRMEMKAPRRSLPQNDRLHAMLTDLSRSILWHGVKLSVDDWKLLFLDALKREMRTVPNIDGDGFVILGRRTSDLTVSEMSDLIELIFKFGSERGVVFLDDRRAA